MLLRFDIRIYLFNASDHHLGREGGRERGREGGKIRPRKNRFFCVFFLSPASRRFLRCGIFPFLLRFFPFFRLYGVGLSPNL